MLARLNKVCKEMTTLSGKKINLMWDTNKEDTEFKCFVYDISLWDRDAMAETLARKLKVRHEDVTYSEVLVDNNRRNVEFFISRECIEQSPVLKKMLLADYLPAANKPILSYLFCGLCGGEESKQDVEVKADVHEYRKLKSSI